ncbi:MAG: hypothetical protein AMXMBFR12_03960 [Candidatus Babeliales bacterium]
MKKKSILLLLLVTILPCMAMEAPISKSEISVQKENCAWCQEPFDSLQPIRTFKCNHALHVDCYTTWSKKAKEDTTDILCAICREPIKVYKLRFDQDEIHKRVNLLTTTPEYIETVFDDGEVKKVFHCISGLIKNQQFDESTRLSILNHFLGFLELDQMIPKLQELIQQRDALDDQVMQLIKQHADDQATITILQAKKPEAFKILTGHCAQKDAKIEKLQQENDELQKKLYVKKLKSHKRKQKIADKKEKLELAISMLTAIHLNLNIKRFLAAIAIPGALGYATHRIARFIAPESHILDAVLTTPITGLSYCFMLAHLGSTANREKALIDHLKK